MLGVLKSLQEVVATVMAGVPDSLRVVLDFIWKVRWFIVAYVVFAAVYGVMMKVLPFLMWSMVAKSVVGSLISLFN